MPVRFLTKQQRRLYGRFAGPPSAEQLDRFFSLDEDDLEFARRCRSTADRLSCAVQIGTLRFLGTFLPDPRQVPRNVLNFVAGQLALSPELLARSTSTSVWARHCRAIQKREGYCTFTSEPTKSEFQEWLATRVWLAVERPSLVFDLATAWLVERRVLLPGATTLERLIATAIREANERLWGQLAAAGSKRLLRSLGALLEPEGPGESTPLDRLRATPRKLSAGSLLRALERWQELSALGSQMPTLDGVPAARLEELAHQAARISPTAIRRMKPKRRLATLLAFVKMHRTWALDDCMDVFEGIFSIQVRKAKEAMGAQLVDEAPTFREAAVITGKVASVFLDESCGQEQDLRARVRELASEDSLRGAVHTVLQLGKIQVAELRNRHLATRFSSFTKFLRRFLQALPLRSNASASPLLRAIEFVKCRLGVRGADWTKAPKEVVPPSWRQVVLGTEGTLDHKAYVMCVVKRMVDALLRRDLYVEGADRWGDPRSKLISDDEWAETRPQVLSLLGRQPEWAQERVRLEERLHQTYRRVGENLPDNPHVKLVGDAELQVSVTKLNRVEEPESLTELKKRLGKMTPEVYLPELLLEVHAHTGFLNEFRQVGGRASKSQDLPVSLAAVLMAEACNIGFRPLVRPEVPALTRLRLSFARQHFFREQTLTRAKARLVEAHDKIPLSRRWGKGELATADGVRFLVPVPSVNSGPNPKYFGFGRGITYYNFTADNYAGFYDLVVPGTLRDSLFLLSGLLEQRTILNPQEVITDTAGASDIIFGLFWMLGYRFSPRLANQKALCFSRMDRVTDLGALDKLAQNVVRDSVIKNQWDEMLRLAGSLKLGRVRVMELTRTLLRTERPMSRLARAFAELGKILRTIHMLEYIDSEVLRRRNLRALNLQESRNRLTRHVCHGNRGQIRKTDRLAQQDQVSAIGLVVNAIVYWNTLYMNAALEQLGAQGGRVHDEDVARLSPLGYAHLHVMGSFSFIVPEYVADGRLRPLGNPDLAGVTLEDALS